MGKTDNLRVEDVREVFRIIGDCRDVGREPALWHQRMLEGLSTKLGAVHAAGGEAWWNRPHHPLRCISAYNSSTAPATAAFRAYLRDDIPRIDRSCTRYSRYGFGA